MIRQEEIKALKEILSENKDIEIKIARSFLEDIVEYFESRNKIGEWIPCSERLPDKTGRYYIVSVKSAVLILNIRDLLSLYDNDGFATRLNEEPIAWQPLPESYKP